MPLKRSRIAGVAVGLAITFGVVFLQLEFARHAGALWRDEVTGANLAAMPTLGDALSHSYLDSFPVAWVSLLHTWTVTGLGVDDVGLRRLGFLVGLAMLPVLWWSVRRLGLDAPLVSLVLFGMSPATIVYGDSVRGYGLGAVCLILSMGAIWAFVERPTWARWTVAQLAALLAVQTYLPNAVLLFALIVAGSAVCALRRDLRTLAATLALGVVAASSLMINLSWIAYAFEVAALEQGTWSLAYRLSVFRQALASDVQPLLACWGIAGALAVVGCAIAWSPRHGGLPRDCARATYALLSAAIAPLAYFAYLTMVARLPTQLWYYLSLVALLALACEVGIDLLARATPAGAALRVGCVALAAVLIAHEAAAVVRVRMTNLDVIAQKLAAEARPDDLVVVVPWTCGITFDRYYRGRAPWITLPDFAQHKFHLHLGVKEKMALGDAGVAAELARIEATLRAGGRVWVVGAPTAPPIGQEPALLPPAPEGPDRWRAAPYLDAWEMKMGALLRDHGGDAFLVSLPAIGPVNTWENLPLIRVDGWRD